MVKVCACVRPDDADSTHVKKLVFILPIAHYLHDAKLHLLIHASHAFISTILLLFFLFVYLIWLLYYYSYCTKFAEWMWSR